MPHARHHDFARPLALGTVGEDHARHWAEIWNKTLKGAANWIICIETNAAKMVPKVRSASFHHLSYQMTRRSQISDRPLNLVCFAYPAWFVLHV